MTRQEFIDSVQNWDDLMHFCWDERYADSFAENIFDESSRDDYINETLDDMVRGRTWLDVYRILDDIPTGYDWYMLDDYGDWRVLDDTDFEEKKQEILDYYEYFDEDDEEEDESESSGIVFIPNEEEQECFEHPLITFEELFAANRESVKVRKEEAGDFGWLM